MRTNCLEEALRLGAIVREIEYKHGKKGGGVQMFRRLAGEAGICSFEVTDVGAGKTTTINMLTGLAWPDAGAIRNAATMPCALSLAALTAFCVGLFAISLRNIRRRWIA